MRLGLGLGLSNNPTGNTLWQPTDLSSLIGWWDASDLDTILETTASGRVKTWQDKSGNDNHVTVANAINEPKTGVASINSLNVITFGDGSATYLDPAGDRTGSIAALDARDISIHIVGRRATTNALGGELCLKNTAGSDFIATNFSTTNKAYFPENTGGGTAYTIVSPSPFAKDTPYLLGFNADSADMIAYNSGEQIAATGAGASSNHFNIFMFGFREAGSKLWIGDLAEVIVANALSTADRLAVEGYLAGKWGI